MKTVNITMKSIQKSQSLFEEKEECNIFIKTGKGAGIKSFNHCFGRRMNTTGVRLYINTLLHFVSIIGFLEQLLQLAIAVGLFNVEVHKFQSVI